MDTVANSIVITTNQDEIPHFPKEGVCIGSLCSPKAVFPALIDLLDTKGTCFLYESYENKREVNNCLERIAWRMALCLPIDLCEFLVYNGGKPGENFVSLNRLPKSFFKSSQAVLFDADSEEFTKNLSAIYRELATRPNAIKASGKNSISEMNEIEVADAGLKYTFVFISDFPHVTEEQKKLISKIVSAGCHNLGLFVFFSWGMNAKLDDKIDYQSFLDEMTLLFPKNNRYYFKNSKHDDLLNKFVLSLDGKEVINKELDEWSNLINHRIEKSTSVSIDIRGEALTSETLWSKSSKYGLEIPIGRVSSKELMNLKLIHGDDSLVHGLIGGTSGSGKSTLLHDIIINGAWLYSPDELQFILLDFKSVEFGLYKNLPHVKVMSTKSDREYGANVLAFITEELDNRKKLFGSISSIEEYNCDSHHHHVPRILVIIDECQNLFVEKPEYGVTWNHDIGSTVKSSFERIFDEARAFGIHLLLAPNGKQGINSLEDYLGYLKIRIILKMIDKGKFLSRDNPIRPDRLKRPKGIYNNNFGDVCEDDNDSLNCLFQYAYYGTNEHGSHQKAIKSEMIKDIIQKSVEVYGPDKRFKKIIYQGGGESVLDESIVVNQVNDKECVVFVGSPIKVGREEVSFKLMRKRGSNVLIVGRAEMELELDGQKQKIDYLESLIRLTFFQCMKQSSCNSGFIICSSSNDSFELNFEGCDKTITKYYDKDGLISALRELNTHLEARQKEEESTSNRMVFALLGLWNFYETIKETEVKLWLENLIIKGPQVGIHTILHADRFADFEEAFKPVYYNSAMTPSPNELIKDFGVKMELKGEDGFKMFTQSNSSNSPHQAYHANIQNANGGEILKFSIYKN
jgi:hypothetical protein